jgi:hypothetical protein
MVALAAFQRGQRECNFILVDGKTPTTAVTAKLHFKPPSGS